MSYRPGNNQLLPGVAKDIMFNDGGIYMGADTGSLGYDKATNEFIPGDSQLWPGIAIPSAAAAGKAKLTAAQWLGRTPLALVNEDGSIFIPQKLWGTTNISLLTPAGSGNNFATGVVGGGSFSHGGLSNTVGTISNASFIASLFRLQQTATVGVGADTVIAINTLNTWIGDAAGRGGFLMVSRFGTETALAQQRAFVGLIGTTTLLTNTSPAAQVNCLGFAYESAETTWHIQHNDGTGTATRVDLGANFPVDATSAFEFILYCPPNSSTIYYQATNLVTGNRTSGNFSTDIPANTVFMCYQAYVNSGTTNGAPIQATQGVYIERPV